MGLGDFTTTDNSHSHVSQYLAWNVLEEFYNYKFRNRAISIFIIHYIHYIQVLSLSYVSVLVCVLVVH